MDIDKVKIDWSCLDTICIYVPTELLAYHLFLLEEAKRQGKVRTQELETSIINTLIKSRKMEEEQCLKK